MRRVGLVVLALVAGACGRSGPSPGADPVAAAEDPAAVLNNSQYPELAVEGLKSSYLLDTGEHLTHVLSFVDGSPSTRRRPPTHCATSSGSAARSTSPWTARTPR